MKDHGFGTFYFHSSNASAPTTLNEFDAQIEPGEAAYVNLPNGKRVKIYIDFDGNVYTKVQTKKVVEHIVWEDESEN